MLFKSLSNLKRSASICVSMILLIGSWLSTNQNRLWMARIGVSILGPDAPCLLCWPPCLWKSNHRTHICDPPKNRFISFALIWALKGSRWHVAQVFLPVGRWFPMCLKVWNLVKLWWANARNLPWLVMTWGWFMALGLPHLSESP